MKLPSFLTEKLPSEVTQRMGRTLLQGKKHSPTVLFAAGVVGVIGTVVLASRATLKASEVLEPHVKRLEDARTAKNLDDERYTETEYRRELTNVYTSMSMDMIRLYGPAVIIGIASVASLTGSHVMMNNRVGALTAAYAALDKGYKEYQKRVIEEFGEEKDREFRSGIRTRKITEVDEETGKKKTRVVKEQVPNAVSLYSKFFDEFNPNWSQVPEVNLMFLRCQQTQMNHKLNAEGHVLLNDVYDALALPRTKEGCVVGWLRDNPEGDGYVDFGIFADERMEELHDFITGYEKCIRMNFNVDGTIYDKI